MKSSGNGKPERCANNLLLIVRGEVPYQRVKGLNPHMIDLPHDTAMQGIELSARWNIENYEPRVAVRSIDFGRSSDGRGDYAVTATVEIV